MARTLRQGTVIPDGPGADPFADPSKQQTTMRDKCPRGRFNNKMITGTGTKINSRNREGRIAGVWNGRR